MSPTLSQTVVITPDAQDEIQLHRIVTPTTLYQIHSLGSIVEEEQPPANAVEAIPNGGYGWTNIIACSLLSFWFNAWTGSWGVLQTALLSQPSLKVSTSTISFVGSLALALEVSLGLLCIHLVKTIGASNSAITGVCLLSLGISISGITTSNIAGLFCTAGALTGFGISLIYTATSTVPNQWFSSKLGLANGLVKVGGGIGATIMAIVLQALIDRTGIDWTFRIFGIMVFTTGVPAAWLLRERMPTTVGPVVDLSMFKSWPFVFIFLAGAIGTFTLFVPPFFLPLFARSLDLSASTGAGLVAAFNACTAVGRFAAGFACDRYGPMNMLLIAMLLNAVSMLAIWPVSSTLAPLIIFSGINGFANGAFFVTMPTATTALMGSGRAATALVMTTTGWTPGYLMGSPIAGILIAMTRAEKATSIAPYRAAIFYAGGIASVAGGCVTVARFLLSPKILKRL